MTDKLNQYLLGELSEQEAEALEAEYFADDSRYEQLQAAESDLIDAFVRGELPADQRKKCEQHFFAAPARQQRLKMALAIAQYSDRRAPMAAAAPAAAESVSWWRQLFSWRLSAPAWQLGFAIVLMFAVAATVIGWLYNDLANTRKELALLRVEQSANGSTTRGGDNGNDYPAQLAAARARARQLAKELEQEHNLRLQIEQEAAQNSSKANTIAFSLLPFAINSAAGSEALKVPANIDTVKFRLGYPIDEDYRTINASLIDENKQIVWQQDRLSINKINTTGITTLEVPARTLANGDYTFTLSGGHAQGERNPLASYSFTIIKIK